MLSKITGVLATLTAVSLIWAFAGLASASSTHAPVHHVPATIVSNVSCAGSDEVQARNPSAISWDTAWLKDDGCWQRASIKCRNPINGDTQWYHGAWRDRVGVWSNDNCPTLAQLVEWGFDYGHYAGSPYTFYEEGSDLNSVVHLTTSRTNPCAADVYDWHEGGPYDYMFGTLWDSNPANCWQQSAFRCHDRNGVEHWFHGGMVTPVGKESGVNCSVDYNEPDQGNINWQQWPVVNSYYYRCVWSCPAHQYGVVHMVHRPMPRADF